MTDTPWSSVVNSCRALLRPPVTERIARQASIGRLLLETIVSDRDYPSGDLSTMDGYAVSEELLDLYRVHGENRPGCGPGPSLEPGTARRIFTGAALPQGATRVIPQEMISREEDSLKIISMPAATYLRSAGSEIREGVPVLHPGTRITPIELSILATLGVSEVCVAQRPVIGHLVTGDELADPDSPLTGSMIRDSNSALVECSLRNAGYSVSHHQRVGDDESALTTAIDLAAKTCDFLLVSGGASVGDHDYARVALQALGFEFVVHGVHLRPGKPIGIARRNHQWGIALPGNPVSHLVALELFVIPILRGLEGEMSFSPTFLEGVVEQPPTTGVPRRPTFWPATVVVREGGFHLRASRFLSSGDLIGIAGANALLYLEQDADVPGTGAKVPFIFLNTQI